MEDSNDIIIFGTGGLGRGIADLISVINYDSDKWNLLGFIDDNEDAKVVNGLRVLGGIDVLENYKKDINVVLALGIPRVKQIIYKRLSRMDNICFPNIIHPSVELSLYNQFGKGNVISKGVALSSNITLGNFNLIHYNCSIGHDISMGDYNSIYPLTALSGYVALNDGVIVGTNCTIIPNIKLEDNSIVGAGSTIIKDVKRNSKVVGVPGRVIPY